ncbi:MAG: cytochrome C oxidase Cbb3 [Desulfuromonas sp.]|nr:MAG: cytochrome C oxidase Cbb3 [Desulfuromonas sp.]
MHRLTLLLLITALTLSFATAASAASAIKGKVLYKKICQSCHTQEGEGGIMGPADKKKEEWKTFFNEDQHNSHPEAWQDLTRKKRKDLLLFFMNYSIDSELPEECG